MNPLTRALLTNSFILRDVLSSFQNGGSITDVVVGDPVAVVATGVGTVTAIGAAMGTAVLASEAVTLRKIGALVDTEDCGAVMGTSVLEIDAEPFRNMGAFVGGIGCCGAVDVTAKTESVGILVPG